MWITTFLALWGLPQWCEGSRCVFLLFLFFCCLFFFLSMVNLNLTPLKIIYRVNNVQILRGKAKFGVWNWASLGPTLNTWTADASRFRQAWRWDALCMYIGLLMGEAWEAEPVRKSLSRHWSHSDSSAYSSTQCQWRVFLQNHSIVAFCVNLM